MLCFSKKADDFVRKVQYICHDKEDLMDRQTMTAVLLFLAGALLILYLLRRRKRKSIDA
jgi:LPXTG-motif cell wall-anchored protein